MHLHCMYLMTGNDQAAFACIGGSIRDAELAVSLSFVMQLSTCRLATPLKSKAGCV